MANIDPTTVDVEDVINRIQAVRRGEMPEDAVSVEELRAAIESQRRRFSLPATVPADPNAKATKSRSTGLIVPNFDLGL